MSLSAFSKALFSTALQELDYFTSPLLKAGTNPIALYRLSHQLGWDFDSLFEVDTTTLLVDFQEIEQSAKAIFLAIEQETDMEVIQVAHMRFKILINRIEDLYPRFIGIDLVNGLDSIQLEQAKTFGKDLAHYLLLAYLIERVPLAFQIGQLFGLITFQAGATIYPGNDSTKKPLRYPIQRPTINWKGLLSPHSNPLAALLQQINFQAIYSIDSLLEEVQRLFQKFSRDLFRYVGKRGLDGLSVGLNPSGLQLIGSNWLPFPEAGAPPILLQLPEPGSPQISIDQEAWHFSWLPDLVQPDGSLTIFEEDWLKITLLPTLETSDSAIKAPGLYLYENDEELLSFELIGGIGIQFPLDLLTDAEGNSLEMGARARFLFTIGTTPQLQIDEMALSGSFHFGGPTGLAIEEANIAIQNISFPLSNPLLFPYTIHLSGTLVLPGTNGSIAVLLNFDRNQVHFKSIATIHLGNGIWLRPIETDRPVLEMNAQSNEAISFSVAGLFQIPKEGEGLAEIEVAGNLELEKNASGVWNIKTFSAAGQIQDLNWELPGKIALQNAGIWLAYETNTSSFKAGINGGFSVPETTANLNLSLEFEFPDFNDSEYIKIHSLIEIEQLLLFDQVYFSNMEMELFVQTKDNNQVFAPSGYLAIKEANVGLFPSEALASTPTNNQFHLAGTEVHSILTFQASGFEFQLDQGNLLLPAIFTSTDSGERASMSIGAPSLKIIVDTSTGLQFQGALEANNINLATENFPSAVQPNLYIEAATLHLPAISMDTGGIFSSNLPGLRNAAGNITIPVSEEDALHFTFNHFSWDIIGIPLGTIYLNGDTDIELGGGFIFSFIGSTPTSTGLSITKQSNELQFEISATLRLTMPVDILSTVDGDTIAIEAGATLKLLPSSQHLEFYNLTLAFIGDFHLGGANGFYIQDGRIEAQSIENILDPTEDHPFKIALSGTLSLPNGPKGGLDNARFIFAGNPLPYFDLDGISGGTGNMNLAGDYLPLNIQELRLQFDPSKSLPEKLYPLNTTIHLDAELNVGDILSGAVEDLVLTFDENGIPNFSTDSLMLAVEGLQMGAMELGGGLGIGGLNNIPDSLVLAGNLSGNFNGTAINALTAFGIVDGLPAPLGAALGVQIGGAGIPLWATGFLLVGARGGISFTGGNADPDDLKNYIIIDETLGSIESHPRPDSEDTADVEPEQQRDTAPAAHAPEDADLEFECPSEPCPPPSVGILYEPHPDTEHYPHRIIVKFSSLPKSTVDAILDQIGLQPAQLQAMTPEAISTQLTDALLSFFFNTLPFLPSQLDSLIRQPMQTLFHQAVEKALANSESIYEALLKEAYKGIRAPNVTVKLTGILSYTGIASFLAVEGGVVISPTVQSAGVVGNLLLLGIPVGRLRGFLTLNNELGLPDPRLCGDVELSLGPLDLGYLRMSYKYGVDFTNLANTLIDLIGNLPPNLVEEALLQVDPGLLLLNGDDSSTILQNLELEQLLSFLAQIMRAPFSPGIRDFMLGLFDAHWDNFNPELLLCGSAQPKLFGMPLDGELVGISAMGDKTAFAANFRFSPSGLLSKCFYNIFPAIDQMNCSIRMEWPPPRPLIAAGLSAKIGTEESLEILQRSILHVTNNLQATIDYEISPLGLKLANAEARMLMPYLEQHPAYASSNWQRPEDRGNNFPSRIEVLMAALDADKLGNIFWKGSNAELKALAGLDSNALNNLELHKDYFPHGGILGSGRLMLPKILLDSPPLELFQKLFTGTILQKVQIAQELINSYILTTRDIGQLAFYFPAPNPPDIPAAAHTDILTILKQVQENGFTLDQIEEPEFYAFSEVFMKGFLGQEDDPLSLLGIPVGAASIELKVPEDGQEGYFEIIGNIPENSWFQEFVDSASLQFSIRKKPQKAIEERFKELENLLRSSSNRSAQVQQLILSLQDDLPKVALRSSIENVKIPQALSSILKLKAHASGELHAYSLLYAYKPNFNKTDFLLKAKNDGGIVLALQSELELAAAYGLRIKKSKVKIGIFPKGLGFPDLAFHFSAANIGLPAGLPTVKAATVHFESTGNQAGPILSTGSLRIEGTIQGQALELVLKKSGTTFNLIGDNRLEYTVKGKIGPIYKPGTSIKLLDTLDVNSTFRADFFFRFHPTNGLVQVKKGQFNWNGRSWNVADFSISLGTTVINWPSTLLHEIQSNAYTVFETFLKDPKAWVEAFQKGAIQLNTATSSAIAEILKALKSTRADTAKYLASIFEKVAAVIEALYNTFNTSMLNVLKVLRAAGFKQSQAIADAIFDLYKGEHIDALVQLFKSHWVNWQNPIRTIMARLLSANFNLEDVIVALKKAFGSAQLQAIIEAARTNWGSNLSKMKNLALALKKAWGDTSTQLNKIVKAFKEAWGNAANLTNIARAIIHAWGANAYKNIMKALTLAWTGTSDLIGKIAALLKSEFTLSAIQIMDTLQYCGFSSSAVTKEMKDTFNTSIYTIANFLKDQWGKGPAEIARRLRDANFQVKYIANALENMGYSIETVGTILKDNFSISHQTVMGALKFAGYGSYAVVEIMRSIFKATASTVANFLKNSWRKNSSSITKRLEQAGYAAKFVANALENLGYSANTVAKRLKEEFSISHNTAMEALKYAGFNSAEVTKELFRVFNAAPLTVALFLKDKWNKGFNSILSIMTTAGYGYDIVVGVLNGIF